MWFINRENPDKNISIASHADSRMRASLSKMIPKSPFSPTKRWFFPICYQHHWLLLQYNGDEKKAWIFNSLYQPNVITLVRKFCDILDATINKKSTTHLEIFTVAQQENQIDCGIYLLHFLEEVVTKRNMHRLNEPFTSKDAAEKRKTILNDIIKISD